MDNLSGFATSVSVHVPLSAPASRIAYRDPGGGSRRGRLFGRTQYGVKYLVDSLSAGRPARGVWFAFSLLVLLIAADNMLWRLAGWIASFTFVRVTGDLRRDMFRHLTGHSPSYFADRLPGMLTSRITATSNAVFTVENMFVWNVLPPCAAMVGAIALVDGQPADGAGRRHRRRVVVAMFRLAAAGKPLHHEFADKAAAVDGEMVDVISNMPLVQAFCGLRASTPLRHHGRPRNDGAPAQPALSGAAASACAVTVVLTIGLLAWAILLWQHGSITTGDVVLACTLGLSVLHATRDLAVALVDVTQHLARLAEALATLLVPHELRDHPRSRAAAPRRRGHGLHNVSFRYPGG